MGVVEPRGDRGNEFSRSVAYWGTYGDRERRAQRTTSSVAYAIEIDLLSAIGANAR
jgi:hypothetical protein